MIKRYTRSEMGKLWTDENEFRTMLDIEIFACEAMCHLGKVPESALIEIKEKANFTVERIREIERETHHDILAFLTNVAEYVGESSKYVHMGLTSSDVKDTALAFLMKQASEILLKDLEELVVVLRTQAKKYKNTIMIGRTHGIHAEPMTFGLKFALWLDETERNIERMQKAKKMISVGKLSGAVGTYSNIDPYVEEYVCEKMGLVPVKLATQVIQRDRHAEFLTSIAIVGSTLDKIATELRNLQRTDIREAEEFFRPGQKGSSAMPHKRNPITSERISGLARLLRGNALAGLENVALWHERDISHSSVERVILPDSTITLDYMLSKTTNLLANILVYPEAMLENLNKTGGLIFSQNIMLALVEKGVVRETAYQWVQRNAMSRWLEGKDFYAAITNDEDVKKYLTAEEITACFDPKAMLLHIDTIMARFNI